MNLVRSIIVPHTIARETAQNTNSKNHLAAAGTVLASMAGRCICEPGLKVEKKPLPPMNAKKPPAPKAKPNPTAQYAIELTLRLVTTLATTVPTFFIRLNPTSSMAKPACMNSTKQAAPITQTVSAAPPAACVAVRSSARTTAGSSAAIKPIVAAIASTGLRLVSALHISLAVSLPPPCTLRYLNPDNDGTSHAYPAGMPFVDTVGDAVTGSKRVLWPKTLVASRVQRTVRKSLWKSVSCHPHVNRCRWFVGVNRDCVRLSFLR